MNKEVSLSQINMKKINKFTKLKNGQYKITFEDKSYFSVHEDLVLKYELLLRKEVDDVTKEKILEENLKYMAYDMAVKYLSSKMRSQEQIRKYLQSKKIVDEKITEVIEMLKQRNYINDDYYVELYVNEKMNTSNDGPNKIRQDLENKGLCVNAINNALKAYTEQIEKEKIEKIVNKMIKGNHRKSTVMLKNKIINYLVSLGYTRSYILDILSKKDLQEDESIKQKEYDKIYKKLSKKYEGKELEYKIRQKMHALGFFSE